MILDNGTTKRPQNNKSLLHRGLVTIQHGQTEGGKNRFLYPQHLTWNHNSTNGHENAEKKDGFFVLQLMLPQFEPIFLNKLD